jgi:transposase
MRRESYPSDVTEQQWAILEPLIPPAKPRGHPLSLVVIADIHGNRWALEAVLQDRGTRHHRPGSAGGQCLTRNKLALS